MLYEPGNSCEICSQEKGTFTSCRMCNARVCESCLSAKDAVCINCQEARCQICGDFLAARACNTCGKLVCEDHGIKVNESTLCDSCGKSDE
jgi:hypothetical protein